MREGTPLAGKALTDAEIDQAAKDMLNVMREPELRSGKPVLDEEGHPKYKTGKLEPSAVYIREIATMGLDRAVADLTGKSAPSEESFNDLPITGVARRSVYEGLLYLRARFADYVAKVRSHQSKNKQGLDQPGWYAILARESRVI